MKHITPDQNPEKLRIAVSHVEPFPGLQENAMALAKSMSLEHIPLSDRDRYNVLLVYTEKGLQIQLKHDKACAKAVILYVDFLSEALNYRRQHGGGIKQALARAVGIKSGIRPSVLDTTAGLGKDSFLLATMGCKVTMIERSPLLAELLRDGLERIANSSGNDLLIHNRITLIQGNAIAYMAEQEKNLPPDTIYLDPMYPHSRKSALNKQDMRTIRHLVGDDSDGDLLLEAALKYAGKRVVVKRPKAAPLLTERSPSHVISMKNSRYDVYMI